MNKTVPETREFFKEFASLVEDATDVDIVVAPLFTSSFMPALPRALKASNIKNSSAGCFL